MAQSILVFDFGANEEAAQQARRKVEAWKQGFRLGDKMILKFERRDTGTAIDERSEASTGGKTETANAEKGKSGKRKPAPKASSKAAAKAATKSGGELENAESPAANNGNVRLLLRLNFSEHEKLSHQRWLDRIPAEEPFKSASGKTIRTGDPEFPKTAELFELLD